MIRNYINPATGLISLITSTSVGSPVKVFTSSTTGGPVSGGVTGRENAVTTIALCNTAAPDPANEATNSVTVNVYIVAAGLSYAPANLVVSELVIPAGETVFFSEERMVLSSGDEIWVGTSSAAILAVTVSALAV
jgi:hypothetical protein